MNDMVERISQAFAAGTRCAILRGAAPVEGTPVHGLALRLPLDFRRSCAGIMSCLALCSVFAGPGNRRPSPAVAGNGWRGCDRIRYLECGAPFDPVEEMTIDLKTHNLTYTLCKDDDAAAESNATERLDHRCTAGEWRFVTGRLSAVAIGKWKNRYVNPRVCDGTYWRLELSKDGVLVRECSGANDWPKDFGAFRAIKKFAMRHPAVRKRPAGETPRSDPLPQPDLFDYVVREGDDVISIAIRFGISPSRLLDLNDLNLGETLTVGRKLKLPRQ